MRISFYGACREVTGSNFLLEVAGKKILLDCGIFQGNKFAEERNFAPFAYHPKEIDFDSTVYQSHPSTNPQSSPAFLILLKISYVYNKLLLHQKYLERNYNTLFLLILIEIYHK